MVDAETGELLKIIDLRGSGSTAEEEDKQASTDRSDVSINSGARKKKKSALARLASKHPPSSEHVIIHRGPGEHTVTNNIASSVVNINGGTDDVQPDIDNSVLPAVLDNSIYGVSDGSPIATSSGRKKKFALGKMAEKRRASSGSSVGSLRCHSPPENEASTHTSEPSSHVSALSTEMALDETEETRAVSVNLDASCAVSGSAGGVSENALPGPATTTQPEPNHDSDAEDITQLEKKLRDVLNENEPTKLRHPTLIKMSSSLPNVAVGDGSNQGSRYWQKAQQLIGSARLRPAETGSMSSLSYSSMPLSTAARTARKRNFLVGGIGADGCLLGAQELDRLLPDRMLTMFVGTWNTAQLKEVPGDLNDFILPHVMEHLPDIYVITLQENSFDKHEWSIKLQETVGPSHVLFTSEDYGSLVIDVFVKRDLIWHLSVAETAKVSTRAFKQWKTKGALGMSLTLFGTSFLFICSHLQAHPGHLQERKQDAEAISKGLNLPKEVIHEKYVRPPDVTARFDVVIWCGDLNFRLQQSRDLAMQLINAARNHGAADSNYDSLLEYDELLKERNSGTAFQEFQEGRITFPPTFKFDIGSDFYDTSASQRVPSYTDRILFRCKKKNSIACSHYGMVPSLRQSDHRAVYGIYRVSLRPGRDTIPLAAGHFDREVFLEAAKRRSLHQLVAKHGKASPQSSVCSVM